MGSIQNPYRSINWKDWTDYSLLPMFSYYLDPQNKIRRKMPPPPGSNIAPDSEIIPRDNSRDNRIDLSGLSQVDGEAIWRKLHGTNAWIRDAEGVVQQVP